MKEWNEEEKVLMLLKKHNLLEAHSRLFQPKRRVVIASMGAFTPLGPTWKDNRDGLFEGRKCIQQDGKQIPVVDIIRNFSVEGLDHKIAAQIKYAWNLSDRFDRRTVRLLNQRAGLFMHYAMMASHEALTSAGLLDQAGQLREEYRECTGVAIGTGGGGIRDTAQCSVDLREVHSMANGFEARMRKVKAEHTLSVLRILSDGGAFWPSMVFGLEGGITSSVNACATGLVNIGLAFDEIQKGNLSLALAGGVDEINDITFGVFSFIGATSKEVEDPTRASRPFSDKRDGFVMGEGAAVLVLAELGFAVQAGLPILAEILGWARTSDAKHPTDPDTNIQARCIVKALKNAQVKPEEVDYINPHATSTPNGDPSEVAAIKRALGEEIAAKIPVGGNKSVVGHLLGGAGSLEAAACVQAIMENLVPPTINTSIETLDPRCTGLKHVFGEAARHNIRTALKISFGFGGDNAVMVFRKFNG